MTMIVSRQKISFANLVIFGVVIAFTTLVGSVIVLAAQTITSTVADQFRRQEQQIVEALARQTEFLFNTLSDGLSVTTSQSSIQAVDTHRAPALESLARLGERHHGIVHNILRLDSAGSPRYGWPPDLQTQLANGQSLDWQISPALAATLTAENKIQFQIIPAPGGGLIYLLVAPVAAANGTTELLVAELDLLSWLAENLNQVDLGDSGQLWLVDEFGRMLYQASPTAVDWSTPSELPIPLLLTTTAAQVLEYQSADGLRQAAFAPIEGESVFFVVLISRLVAEAYQDVARQLTLLTVLSATIIALIMLIAWAVARQNLLIARRRQAEEERRQVVTTLLSLSRAVNSSLDLNIVLERILAGLSGLMDYDGASIMLLEGDSQLRVMVKSGMVTANVGEVYRLNELQAAQKIVRTGQPILMPDVFADDLWSPLENNPIQAWLGVPLRVEGETVGVLNINSLHVGGFRATDSEVALAFADQAGAAIHTARLHRMQVQHYEQDLANARDIQTSLLPQEEMRLPRLAVVGRSRPAQVVSGDFYQYLPRLDGRFGLAVGDITGKGMPAALLMAVLTTALRREFESQTTLVGLFNNLNSTLMQRMQARHMNGALVMAVFEPDMSRAEVINAGMVQPYWRNGQGEWRSVPVGGYPLGASIQRRYDSHWVTLEPGTMLVFVSDGVTEAKNSAGEFFSFDRLETLLRELPPEMDASAVLDAILTAVSDHLGELSPQDDMTVVVTQVLAA